VTDVDAQILLETLRLTKADASTWTYEISSNSRTTVALVCETLSRTLERDVLEQVQLASGERFKLAFEAARSGGLLEAAKTLDWREFERFTEECLKQSGFQTERNVRLNDGKNRWEIDVIARKGPMLLCFDCKHWAHTSPQRLRDALEHQRKAAMSLMSIRHDSMNSETLQALPIVLALFDASHGPTEKGVVVPVARLQDFLEHITPYDPTMPFITQEQKPIKGTTGQSQLVKQEV
jgi:Holliday junction resolvase-like predicted endonuclease